MFREIREIKTSERITDKVVEEKNEEFKQIKPKTNMTVDEAKDFVNSLFGFM